MKEGLLSVVITTYEREFSIIEQSIKSILEQTYKNLEIIIVDDNHPSSDYSKELEKGLEKYPNINYIKLKQNSGACYARNIGILESKGEFVGFLDDDDLWLPEKSEKQLACFKDKDVALVFCEGLIFDDNDTGHTKPYYTTYNFSASPKFDDILKYDYIGSTSQAIIRKKFFARFGLFDFNLPARQDYEMWLRILKSGLKAVGVKEPLFMHRMHRGEQISKNPKKALRAKLYLMNKYKDSYKKNKRACFILFTTISGHYFACNSRTKGIIFAIRAFAKEPVHFFAFLSNRKKRSVYGFKFED